MLRSFIDILRGTADVLFTWASFLVVGMWPTISIDQVLDGSFTVMVMANLGGSDEAAKLSHISQCTSTPLKLSHMVEKQQRKLINA